MIAGYPTCRVLFLSSSACKSPGERQCRNKASICNDGGDPTVTLKQHFCGAAFSIFMCCSHPTQDGGRDFHVSKKCHVYLMWCHAKEQAEQQSQFDWLVLFVLRWPVVRHNGLKILRRKGSNESQVKHWSGKKQTRQHRRLSLLMRTEQAAALARVDVVSRKELAQLWRICIFDNLTIASKHTTVSDCLF